VVRSPTPKQRRSFTPSQKHQRLAAPWDPFPLVELSVFVALILLVVGFILGGRQGSVLLVVGVALGCLAGMEISLREHLAGYKSHTLVLAGVLTVAVMALLFMVGVSRPALAIIGASLFLTSAVGIYKHFRTRVRKAVAWSDGKS
jgi:hypothetical protein